MHTEQSFFHKPSACVTCGYGYVRVKWNAVTGADSYRVYRKFGSGDWIVQGNVAGTQFDDYNVSNNIRYTYSVRALNASGKVVGTYDSKGMSIDYYAAPTLLKCERESEALVTTWEAVEGITYYEVLRKMGTGSWVSVTITTATSYTDMSVPSGTKCFYTVRCVTAGGSILSAYNPVGVGETAFTEYPVLKSATREEDSIHIEWESVVGATRYNLYRKTGARTSWGDPYVTAISGTEYYDYNLNNGTTYYYTVTVSNSAGKDLSEYDNTGVNATYYSSPVMTNAINDTTGVKVTWNKVDGVGAYQVYRKQGNKAWTPIAIVSTTDYTDTSAVANGTYRYTASCMVNGIEVSAYDNTGVGTTYYPSPSMSSIKNQSGKFVITWKSVDGIGTYRLYRKANNGSWKGISDFSTTTYTDTDLTPGTKYTYTVRCVKNGKLVSSFDSTISMTYLKIPAITVVSPSAGTVKVTWGAVTGATRYEVYYKKTSTEWTKVGSTTGTTFTQTGLNSNTYYMYLVKAFNSDSDSGSNNGVGVTVK